MANKKRLIDANVLVEGLELLAKYEDSFRQTVILGVVRTVKNTPTVDAVEVVRCKDCKHWHEETGWCYHHSHFIGEEGEACHPWESHNWKMLKEDDFCSYGERKNHE